jgi:carbon-monoxide dehydrogenase small subunit
MDQGIVFQLNGETVVYHGSATARLLDVLRDTFALTGVKCGCKEGECGSQRAAQRQARQHFRWQWARFRRGIVTIEGYSKTARFAVLSAAYDPFPPYNAAIAFPA